MKSNQNGWLPAQVRYDKVLGDKCKLLFAEISACVNAYGICDADTKYFSAALGIDHRTITKQIEVLHENGHIQKVIENGKHKIKLINRGLELPPGVEIFEEFVSPPSPEVVAFTLQIAQIWGMHLKIDIQKPELYVELVNSRLHEFSKEEMLTAVRNRTTFLNMSEWHRQEQNWQAATSLNTFLNSRESVLKWLNSKPKTDDVELKPFVK